MMKKLILASMFASLATVPSVFGSTIFAFCGGTPAQFAGGSGSGSVNCQSLSALGVTGVTVNAVDLYYLADWQFGMAPSNTVMITFAPAAGTWVPPSTLCTITGNGSSATQACTPNGLPTNGTALNATSYALAGDVSSGSSASAIASSGTLVSISSSVASGSAVATSSGGAIIGYDYTVPSTGAPEPATLALVGSALLGLGVIGRKRLSR